MLHWYISTVVVLLMIMVFGDISAANLKNTVARKGRVLMNDG